LTASGKDLETSDGHHGDVSDPLVLVVEEEPMVREVLARYLERDGFRVGAVADYEQAIEAFSTARPDLVPARPDVAPGRRLRSLPPPPLPGMLGAFSVPGPRALVLTVSAKVSRRSVRDLARLAEQTAGEGRRGG